MSGSRFLVLPGAPSGSFRPPASAGRHSPEHAYGTLPAFLEPSPVLAQLTPVIFPK